MSDARLMAILKWLAADDCGISSCCIAYTAIGLYSKLDDREPPADPEDLGRCLRLLKLMPWARTLAFPRLRRKKQWHKLIKNWDRLAGMMEKEVGIDWSKGETAHKTYAAMKKLGL